MRRAYTIGSHSSYDRALATQPAVIKWGQRLDEDPPYEGGWVWSSKEQAAAFLEDMPLTFEGAVYELELPSGWDADVSPEPHPDDGVHRLIHDAVILRRVG